MNRGSAEQATSLRVVDELEILRAELDRRRDAGERIALVPTMGGLHAGHLALVQRAREVADFTVATIFVNPFQFGVNEDFDSYPRTFERDRLALEAERCDLLFMPRADTVYPEGPDATTRVEVPGLSNDLCGRSRPTFFRGVATVVNILLNMVQPDVALFGEKDFQQLLVVRRMVRDLRMRVRIESVATVREHDGLAMSSRNAYLTETQRAVAPIVYRTLCETRDAIAAGERGFSSLCESAMAKLESSGLKPDYFAVRRECDLREPVCGDRALVVLAAAWLGEARLIDNLKAFAPDAAR